MKKPKTVFVSSTWHDFQQEREAIERALHRLKGVAYSGIDYSDNHTEIPKTVNVDAVSRCDVYIGIFAQHYGSDIAEAEYRLAREYGISCLIYFKDKNVQLPSEFYEEDPSAAAWLESLKKEIEESHTISFFSSADELATQVIADLQNLFDRKSNESQSSLELRYLQELSKRTAELESDIEGESGTPLMDVAVLLQAKPSRRHFPWQIRQEARESLGSFQMEQENVTTQDETYRVESEDGAPPSKQARLQAIPLSLALKETRHLVLLGEPGAGKSTTLQFIAHCSLMRNLALEKLGLDGPLIPVRISFEKIGTIDGKGSRVENWVSSVVSSLIDIDLSQAQQLVNDWLDAGRLIILLDGLDEVPAESRARFSGEVRRFADSLRGRRSRVIVASRLAGYRDIGSPFLEYAIQPLVSQEEVQLFTQGWLHAFRPAMTEKELEVETFHLLALAQAEPGLSQVIKNPLLLRLLVTLYVRSGQVALNQADLYRRYVEVVAWERAKRRNTPPLARDEALQALEIIAWRLRGRDEAAIDNLADVIMAELPDVKDGRGLVQFFREAMGLLVLKEDGFRERAGFWHPTFREYFVARYLRRSWTNQREQTWSFLKKRLHHPDWRQPILLMISSLDEEVATTVIQQIINAKSKYERELHRDLLLSGECLIFGTRIRPFLRKWLLEQLLKYYVNYHAFGRANGRNPDSAETDQAAVLVESIFASTTVEERLALSEYALALYASNSPRLLESARTLLACIPGAFRYSIWCGVQSTVIMVLVSLISLLSLPLFSWVRSKHQELAVNRQILCTLGKLRLVTSKTLPHLFEALDNQYLASTAITSIGEAAPFSDALVSALVASKHSQASSALGRLIQRNPSGYSMLESFLEGESSTAWSRHQILMAIGVSAETIVPAMEFLIDKERELEVYSRGEREWTEEAIDFFESLVVATKRVETVSPEILDHLTVAVQEKGFTLIPGLLEDVLARQFGESRYVTCKRILPDGRAIFTTVDMTSVVIRLALRDYYSMRKPFLDTVAGWVLADIEVADRFIRYVADSDALIMASMIEERLGWPTITSDPAYEELRSGLAKIAEILSSVATTMPENWGREAIALISENPAVKALFNDDDIEAAVIFAKWRVLYSLFESASIKIWNAIDDIGGQQEYLKGANPYSYSAYSHFRTYEWLEAFRPLALSSGSLKQLFDDVVDTALQIIGIPDSNSLDVVVSILNNQPVSAEFMRPYLSNLDPTVFETQSEVWAKDVKPSLYQRVAAGWATVRLCEYYPEGFLALHDFLHGYFFPRMRERGDYSAKSPDRFFERLIPTFGFTKSIDKVLMKDLLTIFNEYDERLIRGGEKALSLLEVPSPDAVDTVISAYKNHTGQKQIALLNLLGRVSSTNPSWMALVQGALDDSDITIRSVAAMYLGDVRDPTLALIAHLVQRFQDTPQTAQTVAVLAPRVAALNDQEHLKAITGFADLIHGRLQRRHFIAEIRWRLGFLDYGALRVSLTTIAQQLAVSNPKLSSHAELTTDLATTDNRRFQDSTIWLLIIRLTVAAIFSLTINILAAYLQEEYRLLSDSGRVLLVVAVFIAALAAQISLGLYDIKRR